MTLSRPWKNPKRPQKQVLSYDEVIAILERTGAITVRSPAQARDMLRKMLRFRHLKDSDLAKKMGLPKSVMSTFKKLAKQNKIVASK